MLLRRSYCNSTCAGRRHADPFCITQCCSIYHPSSHPGISYANSFANSDRHSDRDHHAVHSHGNFHADPDSDCEFDALRDRDTIGYSHSNGRACYRYVDANAYSYRDAHTSPGAKPN